MLGFKHACDRNFYFSDTDRVISKLRVNYFDNLLVSNYFLLLRVIFQTDNI